MKRTQAPNGLFLADGSFMTFAQKDGPNLERVASRQRQGYTQFGLPLANPDKVLRSMGKSISTYRDIATHPIVAGHIVRREAAVASLVRGWNEKDYKGEARVLQACKDLFASLPIDQISKALQGGAWFGYQPAEIMWRVQDWGSRKLYWISEIDAKQCEQFVFDDENKLRFLAMGVPHGELCEADKFLLARHNATYDNPYGFPIMSMCFWAVQFMRMGVKGWWKFIEKYGMPMLIGKLPRSADEDEYEELADELYAMVEDAIAVIPDDGSVALLERKGGGGDQLHPAFLEYQRLELAYAMLGQNQNVEKNATQASAGSGDQVTDAIRDMDKAIVISPLQRLVEIFCRVNFGTPTEACPQITLSVKPTINLEQAKLDEILARAGAKFNPVYFHRTYGLQDGDLDEEAMEAANRPALPAPASNLPTFAEPQGGPDLAAIDDLEDVLHDALQAQLKRLLPDVAESLLAPIIATITNQEGPDQVMDALIAALPTWDSSALQSTLVRLLFVADTVGRLMVAQELLEND